MVISIDDFLYLQSIGVVYDGDITGVGRAMSVPVMKNSTIPPLGSIGNGIYYSSDSAIRITPNAAPQISHNELIDLLIHLNSRGEYEVYDIESKRFLNLGEKISTDIQIVENTFAVAISGVNGRKYNIKGNNLQLLIDQFNDNGVPINRIGIETAEIGYGLMENGADNISNAKKHKYSYDVRKWMQNNKYTKEWKLAKGHTADLRATGGKLLKGGGRAFSILGAGFILYDIYDNRAIKASSVVDVTAFTIGFFGVPGFVIGLSYFIIDTSTMAIRDDGRSLGDLLDGYLHDNGYLDNGIILDMSDYLFDNKSSDFTIDHNLNH